MEDWLGILFRMTGMAYLQPNQTPLTFTFMVRSQIFSSVARVENDEF